MSSTSAQNEEFDAEDSTGGRAAPVDRGEGEALYGSIFEQLALGTAHVSLDGRLVGVNPRLCEMLGYTPEDLQGLELRRLRHRDDADAALTHVQALYGGVIRSATAEERCLRKDGSTLWVAVTRSLVRGPSGAPQHVIEIVQDISHRKRAEEATERALAGERAARLRVELAEVRVERLQTITSELSRAVTPAQVADVVLTQGLAALYADAGYVALLAEDGQVDLLLAPGYPEEIKERFRRFPLSARVPATDCIRTSRILVIESPEAMRAAYPDALMPHWARTWVLVPMKVGDRAIGALGFTYLDTCRITEEDRHIMSTIALQGAQALERARLYEAEQRARRLREEALAVAAHDLRSPLSSILLSARLLERAAPPGEAGQRARALAQRIERAAERTTGMLRDLLDAATIEAKSLKLDVRPCDADALLAEVVEMLSPIADDNRVRISASPLGTSQEVPCDRPRMLQALSNLVGNALKFTPQGGEITISAEISGPSLRLSISDTGAGIRPEDIPRLFDRYWQARATGSAGTGLGLYIVKGIIEAHGGRISVESEVGVGTTFSLTLPLAREPGGA